MGTILKAKRHIQRFSRTQLRYAMMYVGITSVVLIFLNLYTATTMRNLVFRSKETSLEDKVQMAASAFSGLHTIQEESAEKI